MLNMFKPGTTESDIRTAIERILRENFPRHYVALDMAIAGGCYDTIPAILQNRKDKYSESETMKLLADTLFKYPSDIVIENLIKVAPQWLNNHNNMLIKSAMKYGHLNIVESLFAHKNVARALKREIMASNNVNEVTREEGIEFLSRHMESSYVVNLIKTNIDKRNGMKFVDSLLAVPKIRQAIVAHAKMYHQELDEVGSIDSLKEYLNKLDTFCQFKRKNKARI